MSSLLPQVRTLQAQVEMVEQMHKEEVESLVSEHKVEMVAAAARLVDSERALEAMAAKYEAAKVAMQERSFVALAHTRAEQAVAVHAEKVSNSVTIISSVLIAYQRHPSSLFIQSFATPLLATHHHILDSV